MSSAIVDPGASWTSAHLLDRGIKTIGTQLDRFRFSPTQQDDRSTHADWLSLLILDGSFS
ncbi:MAG TPA: hypothetical protein VL134_05480 [Leptolyngbya sp.]|jgi:hypothetical protein|nr:hypothetical protein [Leptolyngbya sp.]